MTKRILVWLLITFFLANVSVAQAQQAKKIPRIGYLITGSLSANSDRIETFRQGLRELSYVEGTNCIIDWRAADGKPDRLPALAQELVRRKVDVIVSAGPAPTRATKEATSTIPIIMTNDSDPVGSGLVTSLARPGGNITGLSTLAPELSGKRLEILREVVPKLSRVAVLGAASQRSSPVIKEVEFAAKAFGVKLQKLDILDSKDIEPAFRAATKGRADGVLTVPNAILAPQRTQVIEFVVKNRLPAMYHNSQFIDAGGLMYYGVNLLDSDRRAAIFVDKILKGRKPADLPVEQPMKFEFIVNLIAAKQIGLTIPPNVLVRADRVIR